MSGSGRHWVLYLIECQRGEGTVYYAGITTDVARRFKEHASGKGARFTRANPPIRLVATREFTDRAAASRAEAALKKLPRQRKPGFFV
ncbi:MAG: GIY-YIG nuclease family protein [Arenimonas sp.]|nr:GIY-YIG nuclease family protein [Arenimonas sp.]MBP7981502.1 GIY-YIG nuclease family protein [Arenimonas sp.]